MTVAVHISVEPVIYEDGKIKTATLYETNGNNRKRTKIKKFTKDDTEWSGHIWNGRDLVIQEEDGD